MKPKTQLHSQDPGGQRPAIAPSPVPPRPGNPRVWDPRTDSRGQRPASPPPLQRRRFLRQLFAAAGLAGAAGSASLGRAAEQKTREPYTSPLPGTQGKPPQLKPKLRITRLETFLVKPRWLFLKMHTDAGIVGLGEPILEGRAKTCAAAVDEIASYLIGKDPRNVVHHWQAIYRHAFYRGGPILTSALSGVEQALWDIKGKLLGVPVWQLLGGNTRDRIRVYGHFGGDTVEAHIASAKAAITRGFTALKTGPGGAW